MSTSSPHDFQQTVARALRPSWPLPQKLGTVSIAPTQMMVLPIYWLLDMCLTATSSTEHLSDTADEASGLCKPGKLRLLH